MIERIKNATGQAFFVLVASLIITSFFAWSVVKYPIFPRTIVLPVHSQSPFSGSVQIYTHNLESQKLLGFLSMMYDARHAPHHTDTEQIIVRAVQKAAAQAGGNAIILTEFFSTQSDLPTGGINIIRAHVVRIN